MNSNCLNNLAKNSRFTNQDDKFRLELFDPKGERTLFLGGIHIKASYHEISESLKKLIPWNQVQHLEVLQRNRTKVNLGFAFLILKDKQFLEGQKKILGERLRILNKKVKKMN